MFKVVIFSSADPESIGKLIQRINQEAPGAQVCGVLHERRPGKPLKKRMSTFARNLRQPGFVRYAGGRLGRTAAGKLGEIGHAALRVIHAAPNRHVASKDLESICDDAGCRLLITQDYHNSESLEFVRSLQADLGVVYGTGILKPSLFAIPRLGSINIHKRKAPDYRGGGPVGLWEMLDGQPEIGITVHEVVEKLDAGAIINDAVIPIEPYDTLSSLALKAHVVGNDLIVKSVADYAGDKVQPKAQVGKGRMFKNPSAHQLALYEKQLASQRPQYRAPRSRPAFKLWLRSLAGIPIAAMRNWSSKRQAKFPVVVLFHHLVSDRPHSHGMPTDQFVRHLRFLRRHYRIASLSDAIDMVRKGTVTEPTVVLTFDDGYADNFLTLRAIREQIDVPMTLFVSTAHMTSLEPFAHDSGRESSAFPPLSWEQLRQMQREGFEIGSHTRTHFDCGSKDSRALQSEILGSKEDLERYLGQPAPIFSFPFGLPENISVEAMTLACRTYAHVFSAYGGENLPDSTQPVKHLYRRAHPNDLWELELTLQGFLEMDRKQPAPALSQPQPESHALSATH